jgi:bacteriorhodopsin
MKDVIYHSDGGVDAALSSGASSLSTMSAAPVTDLALVDRSPAPTWSGGAMAVTVDRVAAVERLPGSEHQDPYQRLALAFLVGYPANSARAYLGDLTAWGAWGAAAGVHPVDARRQHVDA